MTRARGPGPWFAALGEAAEEVVSEFDAMVNERVAVAGITFETERLCEFSEKYIQRLRVALAMARRAQEPCEDPGEDITDTSLDGPPTPGTGINHPDWRPTIPPKAADSQPGSDA